MSDTQSRNRRIEARIAPDVLEAVKRAAEIEGRSVSDFVVAAARAAAHRTIEESQLLRLSLEAQQTVANLLFDPPPPGPALERAFDAHRRLIRDSK